MKSILIIAISLISFGFLNAQNIKALNQADSLIALAKYDDAMKLIDTKLTSAKKNETTPLLNKKIEVYILQGKLEDAETTFANIPSSGDNFIDGITLTNKGYLLLNKGRYDLATENLQDALQKFQSSGKQNTREGARCLSMLGLVYGSTRRYNQAEENHLVALQIREKLFGLESEEVAASYNDLGTLYLETDPDKALEYFDKALATYNKLHGHDHPKIAIANTNMGFAYRKLELFGDAINDFDEANKIWGKIYPDGHPNQALVLSFLGQTYRQMNDTKTAEAYFERSLQIYKKAYGNKHPDVAKIYTEIGVLELGKPDYESALNAFQNSIIANHADFNNNDVLTNPSIKNYYNNLGMLYSLHYKAQAFESRYYGNTLKLSDLSTALTCLQLCDLLIDDIRYQSTDEEDKFALGEIANEVYEDGVRIAHAISEVTFKPQLYREQAYYFAEKSKSAVLQESIADAQAKSYSGIPTDLLNQENELKAKIAFLTQKISQKPSEDEERQLRQSLLNTNLEYNSFIKKLETDYPNYFNLKFNKATPSVIQTQNTLDNKTAILSLFIAEKNKNIYQFIITKSKFTIKIHSIPADFDRLIKGYTNSLLFSNYKTYAETGIRLKKLLIPTLPSAIENIVLIPSGRLSTIPFESLPSTKTTGTNFDGTEFIINKYSISYEFSSGLMLQKEKSTLTENPKIFLCAPVEFPAKDNLNPLPGSEEEVKTIANLFSSSSKVVTFNDANETGLKSTKLSDYNYLHFATHGIVDEENPALSRIFLNTGKEDDGNLYCGEIYNLNLNSDLAVLSACQTGLGKVTKGEGVIGLSRALTYAGTKNIIVSFWRVSDESTSQLMSEFYRSLISSKSQNFAKALQEAKLQLIKEKKYNSPYYWAPFVLIGY